MLQDLQAFLHQCPAIEIAVMSISSATYVKTNILQLRGKMPVQVAGKQRAFGFKFLLPPDYPACVPLVFLDEPEIPEVVGNQRRDSGHVGLSKANPAGFSGGADFTEQDVEFMKKANQLLCQSTSPLGGVTDDVDSMSKEYVCFAHISWR